MKISRRDDWLAAKIGDELVMMSAKNGKYVGLSAIGARVWEMIEQPRDLDALCADLEQEFDVEPDRCRADVAAFLKELAQHGAVSLDPPPAG